MYTKSVSFYDAIYGTKNYEEEALAIHKLIWKYRKSTGRSLLDVGCGTGGHLFFLQQHYAVRGLDINPDMLRLAHQRCPGVEFYEADMADFMLGYRVDIVISLFSSIGYVVTVDRLNRTLQRMSRHVKPGGVVIVEPWFTPEKWRPGTLHATFVDEPDLKIARMSISEVDGRISKFDLNYLVATPEGISHFVEHHELGLFTDDEYNKAFCDAGLTVSYEPDGLTGRGLYIGTKPPETGPLRLDG
jgi:ubiquinone/menaquinone biosynthesis C-methylase UbiE